MIDIMKLTNATKSLLIILNLEITRKAKEIIQESDEEIVIIQDGDKKQLSLKFREYLQTLEPSNI